MEEKEALKECWRDVHKETDDMGRVRIVTTGGFKLFDGCPTCYLSNPSVGYPAVPVGFKRIRTDRRDEGSHQEYMTIDEEIIK